MRLRAFTLLELLTSIAVIALLVAILYPVFTKAIDSAKITRSVANMKQLHQAVMLYMNDYDLSGPEQVPISLSLVIRDRNIPREILRTGGRSIFGESDLYRCMFQREIGTSSEFLWKEHVQATSGNPVMLVDQTFDHANLEDAFGLHRSFAIFFHGNVVHKSHHGSAGTLETWE